ncbi:efflux RND transporter permease subunit [Paracoccus sp. 1_MG-2023]|uniref:efflux RND transporter permease subunit n=1 Tax=unclassified Paracoccus (in: a-proteobacteria) TaxID=2688777 RepID=UPI001C092073|nr:MULTISPECIES: efflux RND transporter permease subunit [unclassified Paracoccus (in: a-proteobacteria)]MBU2959193.1 efflux RND transporter permease subunit [Paracoccus sp. C2R09]MDO6670070.1 efflux RND transporter permease subunit [Paracoccus sp. 1_MG-2023]
MASFFIHRPVFAWVLAIATMLLGAFSMSSLPISQYPDIAPTTVRISATYTGASAETVENSVTSVIEDGLTGLDGLTYMISSSSEGSASVSLTFDDSIDPDMAQVQVQNKLQLVESQLPDTVTNNGVSVTRSTSSILLVGALVSEDESYTSLELGDILSSTIEDAVQRTEGVGSINSFGTEYAMRIWLNPERLYQYQLTASDVTSAVSEQNTNVTVGSLGDQPVVKGQQFTVSMSAQSQLESVEDFQNILLKTESDGSAVYLADVATVELAEEDYGSVSRFDGHPAAGFAVNLSTGANAVDTAERVREVMDGLSGALPEGVSIECPYDTSPFVEQSIEQVYETLIEAIVLVFLVIFLFLQSWRATIIPTIAVPVVLLGTFGVLSAFGMSINTLSMFALVLAIGLLVDDAIVVVENVERVMEEEGLDAKAATEKSMGEISSALVGIVMVLSAVFLPMAFMDGSTGVIYKQFSVTIISAMVLSLFVALILTPAMCAQLLKPGHGKAPVAPLRWFNNGLDRLTGGYGSTVERLAIRPFRMVIVLALVGVGAYWIYDRLPSSFLPTEDQGVLMTMVELPQGSTVQQTQHTIEQIENYLLTEETEGVASVFANVGFSFSGSGQNYGILFIKLKDCEERPGVDAADIMMRANQKFAQSRLGSIFVLQPPAIPGLGTSSGFTMYLVDQSGSGQDALSTAADQLFALGNEDGRVTNLRGNDDATEPALKLRIDQPRAEALGVSLSDVNSMLSTVFSGSYVNDFPLGNDLREVIVQGRADWRMQPSDVDHWYIRNDDSEMVPLTAFTSQEWETITPKLARYGGTRALEISGEAASGTSSGDAMDLMEELTGELDGSYAAAWTGLSYQERLSGDQEAILYSISALVVFLCLAALYESWAVPFAVMLSVPVGILGALATTWIFGQANDVYFKVGLLTTIGLAARNAILIVEFAESLRARGQTLIEATTMAARQRLRPILMTSLAFGFGILPLVLASGAGANAQKSIGTGMLGGIIFSAVIGVVMVPVFYVAVIRTTELFGKRRKAAA